ncbi:MAG: hypothetical protein Kow006_20490 [Gammaproteobacteria bacterium]
MSEFDQDDSGNAPLSPERSAARLIAVASGKGGVGKTTLVANLAIAVAARGYRVCIVDADPGMANINILLGFSPARGLAEVLNGDASLAEALFKGPQGVAVLAGASGMVGVASFTRERRELLLNVFARLEEQFDVIFVDLAAGADTTVTDFLRLAHHRLVVVTPDPTSLTNAYSLLKILETETPGLVSELVVNQANDDQSGLATFHRLKKVCDLFLKNRMEYLGYICDDPTIVTSVRLRRPVVLLKHDAPASRCFYQLAQSLLQSFKAVPVTDSALQRFYHREVEEAARHEGEKAVHGDEAPPQGVGVDRDRKATPTGPASGPAWADTENRDSPRHGEPDEEPLTDASTLETLDTLASNLALPSEPPDTQTAAETVPESSPQPPPLPPLPSSEELAAVDAMAAPLPDRAAVIEQLAKEMSSGEMNEHEAGMIVLSLLSSCLNGYGRYPIDIRALVNAAINRRELSAEALRHLASQLQQTYRDRFGHELYPVDSGDSKASNH